eukprot:TRINITY_DN2543_c0_g4_i2.p1 TRINITY_DN2543_c0_g4~~TRINITY_DN2543_c0_g4_i2.p1  ORF type:complete len:659 (-),score=130.53 TRINITY_DN2543_c0_g4_i2:322-2181(-)
MTEFNSSLDLKSPPSPVAQAKPFPRVDIAFPELPSDAHMELPSWRSGLHSDWQLRVGPSVYRIHKVLTGHGPRASSFLCSAFTTGQQFGASPVSGSTGSDDSPGLSGNETDLSHILPEQVWQFFSQVLDFIYCEDLSVNAENAVPLLRCADALQIRMLFLRCVEGINELLSEKSAPRILADSFTMLGGPLQEQISKAAEKVVAQEFDSYEHQELQQLPTACLAQILRRDDIAVMHENKVFDFVCEASESLALQGRAEEAVQLWQCIRLGALSNSYMVKAATIEAIPKMALIWSKVLHRKCGGSLNSLLKDPTLQSQMEEGWPIAPPLPRKPFKDLTCAVMYSVDTDANFDQDVERNVTAATLVAEEIEFLGGRAILENIFARRPNAGEAADTGIINMDQVDVAFVLAPWTPSEKRVARLINFVDRGGGAVLLSFIGGLSKGVWRDLEYEPLITGKVADNTPYEDVHLSNPINALLDYSCLHGQDSSAASPQILSGVDSINGRRRITSKLVEGAKILAKWSDGQPLVVQHADKNVFSISQRVSRIFELDEDLGHDDTLQLVLNVMVQAGKEAKRLKALRAAEVETTETTEASGRRLLAEGGHYTGGDLGGTATGGVNVSL